MNVVINGEKRKLPDNASVLKLIEQLQLSGRRLAVEVNGDIVAKSRYAEHILAEGDRIEVVHAIGGG